MKEFRMLIFIVLAFVIIDFGTSRALHKFSEISQIRFSKLYYRVIDADMLIFGNSRAVNSFYAPYLEKLYRMKVFNLAYNGLSMPVAKTLFDDYLLRNKAPRYVIIEVSALGSDYKALLNLKQYMYDSVGLKAMVRDEYSDVYYASHLSRTYIYNSEYFLRTLYYLEKTDQDWINHYSISKELYESLGTKDVESTTLSIHDSESMSSLKAIVSRCIDEGIEVVLVLAPIIDKIRVTDVVGEYVRNIEKETGLKVLDMSDVIPSLDMFADSKHTNEKGAEFLADYMKKSGVITVMGK